MRPRLTLYDTRTKRNSFGGVDKFHGLSRLGLCDRHSQQGTAYISAPMHCAVALEHSTQHITRLL